MKIPDIKRDVIAPYRGAVITVQTICRPDLNQPAGSLQLCVMMASDTDEGRYSPAESVDLTLDLKGTDELIGMLTAHRERLVKAPAMQGAAA